MSIGSGTVKKSWADQAVADATARAFVQTFNVPLAGGISKDAKTVYMDKAIPRTYTQRDGKVVPVWKYLCVHEFTEKCLLDAGWSYDPAHALATFAEEGCVKADGYDTAQYNAFWDDYEPVAAKHKLGDDTPPDLELKPYGKDDG